MLTVCHQTKQHMGCGIPSVAIATILLFISNPQHHSVISKAHSKTVQMKTLLVNFSISVLASFRSI